MTQTLRILRKDVRHLAPFILVVLALQTALAVAAVRQVGIVDNPQRLEVMLMLGELLLPFAWLFLLALNVLQDPLVGDNSFWLTRPYSWPSLLLAKILFSVVFLNIPLLVSDCLILRTLGLPFELSHLLFRQLPILALVVVPSLAFASISRSVSQFSLWVVTLILVFITGSSWFAHFQLWDLRTILDVAAVLSILLTALFAVATLFAKRATLGRFLLTAVMASLLPATFFTRNAAFLVPKRSDFKTSANWSQVRFQIESGKPHPVPAPREVSWLGVRIPVNVQGLPPGAILRGHGETIIMPLRKPVRTSFQRATDGSYFMDIDLFDRSTFGTRRVDLQTSLDIWVLNEKAILKTTSTDPALFRIPEIGICKLDSRTDPQSADIECWSGPIRPVDVIVSVRSKQSEFPFDLFSGSSDQGDELVLGFTPIQRREYKPLKWTELTFTKRFPVARFHTTFSAQQFSISDYKLSSDIPGQ